MSEPPPSPEVDATGHTRASTPDETATTKVRANRASAPSRKTAYGIAAVTLVIAATAITVPLLLTSSPSPDNAANVAVTSTPGGAPSQGASSSTGGSSAPSSAHASTPADSTTLPVTGPTPVRPADPVTVKKWNTGPAGAALKQVTNDSGAVLMAHASGQYTQMLRGCQILGTEIKAVGTLPPIPDPSMQKLYSLSLSEFKTGIADCEAGITQRPEGVENVVTDVNKAQLNQAVSELSAGVKNLYLATGALRPQ